MTQNNLFKIRKMKTTVVAIVCFFIVGNLFSQDYQWQCKVDSITQSSFYRIDLPPKIISKLNSSYADVRIMDEEEKEVPFFMERESFLVEKRVFKEYEVVEKKQLRNGATVLIVRNEKKNKINNIRLQIKNFDVNKHLELAGSDDNKNWFTIKEDYLFNSANGSNKTSEIKILNFPYSNYEYYRVVIFDVFTLPINIVRVGYYDTYKEEGKFKRLDQPTLTRKENTSTNQTFIKVSFKETPYLDKISLNIDKPKYYYREARLCLEYVDKKGDKYYSTIKDVTLSSDNENDIYVSDFSHKEFYLIIDNEDNPSLGEIELEAFQLGRYLTTYLESDQQHRLVFGNKEAIHFPNYDISRFKGEISSNPIVLSTHTISANKATEKEGKQPPKYWIWIAIAVVAVLLGIMSYKMINEMEKK